MALQQQHCAAVRAWIAAAIAAAIADTKRASLAPLPLLSELSAWTRSDPRECLHTLSHIEQRMRELALLLPPEFLLRKPLPPVLWSQTQSMLSQCVRCSSSLFRVHEEDGAQICTNCNTIHYQFVDSKAAHGSGYGNGINGGGGGTSSEYFRDHEHHASSAHNNNQNQRLERFLALLQPFRGRDCRSLFAPDHYARICERLTQDRVRIPDDLNEANLKYTLQALGLHADYNQHINALLQTLGKELPYMNDALYDLFQNIFVCVEQEWMALDTEEHRSNFINYTFLAAQCALLTDQHQFLPFFRVIKDPKKLAILEELWKRICRNLGYQFISILALRQY